MIAERNTARHHLKPRDAATLIVYEKTKSSKAENTHILMGRRHKRHVFMPGYYVFPGGRVDPSDSRAPVITPLHETIQHKLMQAVGSRFTATRAQALALAALRETYEEAGILIGEKSKTIRASKNAAWQDFLSHGIIPTLSNLSLIARAITPPGRARRFDTRFFTLCKSCVTFTLPAQECPSDELEDLQWLSIKQAKTLDLPLITRLIIEEFEHRIHTKTLNDPSISIPFYRWRGHHWQRLKL